MIICICRDIRESHYSNREDLIKRVLEEDYCCGTCLKEFLYDGGDKYRLTCNRKFETDSLTEWSQT